MLEDYLEQHFTICINLLLHKHVLIQVQKYIHQQHLVEMTYKNAKINKQ